MPCGAREQTTKQYRYAPLKPRMLKLPSLNLTKGRPGCPSQKCSWVRTILWSAVQAPPNKINLPACFYTKSDGPAGSLSSVAAALASTSCASQPRRARSGYQMKNCLTKIDLNRVFPWDRCQSRVFPWVLTSVTSYTPAPVEQRQRTIPLAIALQFACKDPSVLPQPG